MRREDGQALIEASLAFSLTTDETAIAFVLDDASKTFLWSFTLTDVALLGTIVLQQGCCLHNAEQTCQEHKKSDHLGKLSGRRLILIK